MAWSRELIVSREGGNRGGHLCEYSMRTAENSILLLHEPGHLPVQVVVARTLEGCYVNKETGQPLHSQVIGNPLPLPSPDCLGVLREHGTQKNQVIIELLYGANSAKIRSKSANRLKMERLEGTQVSKHIVSRILKARG